MARFCRLGGSIIWPSGKFQGWHVHRRSSRDLDCGLVKYYKLVMPRCAPGAKAIGSDVVLSVLCSRKARGVLQRAC
jgi:hypothetical protein